jgi:hypothetical protein
MFWKFQNPASAKVGTIQRGSQYELLAARKITLESGKRRGKLFRLKSV